MWREGRWVGRYEGWKVEVGGYVGLLVWVVMGAWKISGLLGV